MDDGFKGCYVCDGAGYIMVAGRFSESEGEACPLCIAIFQRNKAETERKIIQAKYEALLDNLTKKEGEI